MHSHRVALQKQVSERREAAARAAEKAAIEKAAGRRATKRAPALEKARNIAVQHRSQVPRAKPAPTALTREEKRMKRMAKDMGVPFEPMSTRPPKTPSNNSEAMMSSLHKAPTSLQSSASHSSIHAPARRPMTAREKFIEAERLRKEAKDKHEEHQDSYEDEDMFDEVDYENEDDVLEDNNVGPSHASIRDQIWQLFGRNRQAYVPSGTYVCSAIWHVISTVTTIWKRVQTLFFVKSNVAPCMAGARTNGRSSFYWKKNDVNMSDSDTIPRITLCPFFKNPCTCRLCV